MIGFFGTSSILLKTLLLDFVISKKTFGLFLVKILIFFAMAT